MSPIIAHLGRILLLTFAVVHKRNYPTVFCTSTPMKRWSLFLHPLNPVLAILWLGPGKPCKHNASRGLNMIVYQMCLFSAFQTISLLCEQAQVSLLEDGRQVGWPQLSQLSQARHRQWGRPRPPSHRWGSPDLKHPANLKNLRKLLSSDVILDVSQSCFRVICFSVRAVWYIPCYRWGVWAQKA